MPLPLTADTVFADGPSTSPNNPAKSMIRRLLRGYEDVLNAGLSNGGLVYDTKANLDADLDHDANASAWVVADGDNNGIYRKSGASGSGSWSKVSDLPFSVAYAQNSGTGTANAVEATSGLPIITTAYAQLISVPFVAANTGAMTLSINGETARSLVTNTGAEIASGYIQAGMSALVQIDSDGKYRLFSYGDASAVQAAAEAAQAAAEVAAASLIRRDTVALLVADEVISYSAGAGKTVVTTGQIIEAQGFRYEVAASDATDQHLETAGGVKVYVLPGERGYDAAAFDPADVKVAIEGDVGSTNAAVLPIGTYTLSAGAAIGAYSSVQGSGDESRVMVPAGATGIAYTSATGVYDDHPHNVIRDFRLSGDGTFAAYPAAQTGTSKGLTFATVDNIGSLGNAEGMVFELHDTGRHIKKSYGHTGRRNYYRANKIGLKLESVTSFAEYDIYARYNSTAAVQIIGGQNVSLIGGAIEGNQGKGLEYVDNGSTWGQLNLDDVYFESNGDRSAGVWSIDIPFGSPLMVNVRGGNYWSNTLSGVASGPFRFGDSLSMDGATINANFYAKEVVGFRNCRGVSVGVWNTMDNEANSRLYGLTAPAIFHEFKPAAYEYPFTSAASGGLIIATKVMGRSGSKLPANAASAVYPYGLIASGGASATENAALDYGDGSWWKATFAASAGSFSSNYATLASFADTTKQFRAFCVLILPEADFEVGFIQSIGGQATTGYYKLLANTTYRIVLCGMAPMTAGSFLRMFPLNSAGASVNVLPIWQSQSATWLEMIKIVEMLVEGTGGSAARQIEATVTYDPPSLAAGALDAVQTMTVTGAALGDLVEISFSADLAGARLEAWVSATDTVSYRFSNPTDAAIDLASGTVKARIRK